MQKFRKILTYFLGVLVYFFFIYGQEFSFLPIGIAKITVAFCSIIFLGNALFVDRYLFLPSFRLLKSIAIYFLLVIIYIYANSFLQNTEDYSLAYNILLDLVEFWFGSYIILLFFRQILNISKLEIIVKIIILSVTLQSFFIFYSLYNPLFILWTIDILPEIGNISADNIYRLRGFTNGSGATLSIVQSFGVILPLLLIESNKRKFNLVERAFFWVCVVLNLFSTFLIGRSGLIVSLVVILTFFFLMPIKIRKGTVHINYKIVIGGITFILLLFFLPLLVFTIMPYEYQRHIQEGVLPHAFEFFINIFEDGKFTSASSEHFFSDMIKFPTSIKTWILGDGIFTLKNGGNYLGTDSGYLRILLAVGVLGFCLLYFLKIFIIFKTLWANQKQNFFNSFLLLTYLSLILIFEVKEPFLFKGEIVKLIYSLFLLLVIKNGYE